MAVELEPDPPEYPPEWTPAQRMAAYWYHLAHPWPLRTVNSWRLVLRAAEKTGNRTRANHQRILAENTPPPVDLDTPPPEEPPW